MTVWRVVTRDRRYEGSGTGYSPRGEVSLDGVDVTLREQAGLAALVEAMTVANDSEVREDDGRWTVTGEPTEGALRTLGHKVGFGYRATSDGLFNSRFLHEASYPLARLTSNRVALAAVGALRRHLSVSPTGSSQA